MFLFLRILFIGSVVPSIACSRPLSAPPGHFNFPIPSQATTFSLDPANCGSCHSEQYQAWRLSLHARAISPGLLWQLALFEPEIRSDCLNCHAPLAEQKKKIAVQEQLAIQHAAGDGVPGSGVICASCHVRDGGIYGPGYGNLPTRETGHPQSVFRAVFRQSEFCLPCHQRPENGKKVNGKPLMDVYQQYLSTGLSKQGVTCQSCHMPGRLHRWFGIQNPEFTEKALTLDYQIVQEFLNLRLRNNGVGHHFPAYSVPLAVLKVQNEAGKIVAEQKIGWQLDVDLREEFFDTRIPRNQETVLSVRLKGLHGKKLLAYLEVFPSDFYHRMFRNQLAQEMQSPKLPQKSLQYLQTALAESQKSYRILNTEIFVPAPVKP